MAATAMPGSDVPSLPADARGSRSRRLKELAALFLKLGTVAFGGPAAHTALMEDEVVRRRQWLTRERFLDLLGATNLIPGPNSTELAIHVGYDRAGLPGLLVAGSCFILPAALIVGAIAWAYVRFGRLPEVAGVLYGVKPVVIAVVAQALWRLGGTAVRTRGLAAVGAGALLASLLGVDELVVLFGAAALVAAAAPVARRRRAGELILPAVALPDPGLTAGTPLAAGPATVAGVAGAGAAGAGVGLWPLFLVFLKIGSVLFGSGYVLLAFLRADLVERHHWLTEAQLLDAVAVGQVTPGPVFTTATFVGYLLAGPAGAAVATVGIFLPAFAFVAASAPFVPRLRRSPTAGAFLDGLNVASLALMAAVTLQLGRAALVDPTTVAVAAASAVLLLRYRVNATWLVAGGAVVGLAATWWGR
ncbi:MAG: chromate transporter, chromate ion transporter family [Phycisphaerales bacterium]|nr:chromate transporter, chromate ion transporter family [Phycisphaerales bacterium]